MLVFLLHISISFMVLGISLIPAQIVEVKKSSVLKNTVGLSGLLGIMLVGTGIYIGGGESLQPYFYITFIVQLLILCFFIILYSLYKKSGYSTFINIFCIFLAALSHFMYGYYIVASFLY